MGIDTRSLKKKLKKLKRSKGQILSYVGLALLAVATAAVVGYTLFRAPAPVEAGPAVAPVALPTTGATAPKVAFMGDSYTAGTGSTSPAQRWTTLVSAQLGWQELNFGQGGSGFTGGGGKGPDGKERLSYPDMLPTVVKAKPDMVVVATAGNDFNRGPEAFKPAIAKFFTDLRADLPKAKIVVVSPMWRGPQPHPHLADLTQALQDGATSAKGTYLSIGDDFQTSLADGLLGPDKIHPNDKGHAALAEMVSAAYQKAFPVQAEAARKPVKDAMALLGTPKRKWTMTVIGDSTGNEPGEWVYLLAEEWSKRYNRPVIIHNWSIDSNSFADATTVGSGANAAIEIWNSSASGKDGVYSLKHFDKIAVQRPDLVVISHGHNVASAQDAALQVHDLEDFVSAKWSANPPSLAVTLQNPRVDDEAARMDSIVARLRAGWGSTQPATLIDVYGAYKKHGDIASLVKEADGFHPNEAGEQVYFETINAALR